MSRHDSQAHGDSDAHTPPNDISHTKALPAVVPTAFSRGFAGREKYCQCGNGSVLNSALRVENRSTRRRTTSSSSGSADSATASGTATRPRTSSRSTSDAQEWNRFRVSFIASKFYGSLSLSDFLAPGSLDLTLDGATKVIFDSATSALPELLTK